MNVLIKKENCVELACLFRNSRLPNNFDITIYAFLSAFQRKEQLINFWETRKSCVMAATELLSHFLAKISWDFFFMFGQDLLIHES